MKSKSAMIVNILTYDFSIEALPKIKQNPWIKQKYSFVYVLQNKGEGIVYIGESLRGTKRIEAHLKDKEKEVFDKISIIGSNKFNKSATLTIESQLIEYVSGDRSIILQNGNNGQAYHKFYERHKYDKLFEKIWTKLLDNGILTQKLEDIRNSDFFKYSPYKSLNGEQYDVVLNVLKHLNEKNTESIIIQGGSGTGKTILMTYLIKLLNSKYLEEYNLDDDGCRELELMKEFKQKRPNAVIGIVVPVKSFRGTLKKAFKNIPDLKSDMVISPSQALKKKYDILIIDEAHRLHQGKNISWLGTFKKNNRELGLDENGTELNWVRIQSDQQIFFYDKFQSIRPSDVSTESFDRLMGMKLTVSYRLKSQMRVRGGIDYIDFVDKLLNCQLGQSVYRGKASVYDLKVFDSLKSLYAQLEKKEKRYKLCRMLAGYAWKWKSKGKKNRRKYDIQIGNLNFRWNSKSEDWINSPNAFNEIGCIHTTQGYDLNYAGVIFGKDISYNPELDRIEINVAEYHDRNGKAGIAKEEDLKQYIINIYKTLMYRGAFGTYIYVCDENLREYMKEKIQSARKRNYRYTKVAFI